MKTVPIPESVLPTTEFFDALHKRCVAERDNGNHTIVVCELEQVDYGRLHEGGEELPVSELKPAARAIYAFLEISGFKPWICTYYDRPSVWLITARLITGADLET